MGKRERHAEKLARQGELKSDVSAPPSAPKRAGFVDGWRWGSAALGLALRRPGFSILGHLMLLAVGLAAALAQSALVWIVALLMIVMGVECAGSAARAGILAPKGHPSPWRAWIEPLRGGKAFGMAVGRTLALGAFFPALGALAEVAQRSLLGSAGANLAAAALSFSVMFLTTAWLMVAAAPAGGAKALARSAGRALGAPTAVAGLCLFWALMAILLQVSLSLLFTFAAGQGGSQVTMTQMGALMALFTVAFCGPLAAFSGGIGAGDLQERARRKALLEAAPEALDLTSGSQLGDGPAAPVNLNKAPEPGEASREA